MLLGDGYKPFYVKGYRWLNPQLFNPGAGQIVAPARSVMAQLWLIGGGGRGGSTAPGRNNGRSNAGGGGAGGLSISNPFVIRSGQIITIAVGTGGTGDGGNTTAVFAPAGINMFANGGGRGGAGNANGAGTQGPGGTAGGGAINVQGGNGGSGNGQNGRGGGGGAPNNADGGNQGPNSGYMGNCMTNIGGIFAVLNAVGIGTPLCGYDSVAASDGRAGDRGSGGSGASRTRDSGNSGGLGGNGLLIARFLVKV